MKRNHKTDKASFQIKYGGNTVLKAMILLKNSFSTENFSA
jgi:hypothetical protein